MWVKQKNFIERSILGALSFFKESIYTDEYAAKRGFLQSLDPRMGVMTALSFILLILFAKHILLIALIYVVCLLLAWSSKISLRFFLMRTWFFIPLFSLFIAIPALFSV
ncbi:MAG: cobalt ECF transporter T component CbiQ, partial [bacterium]|nr:cobalt ECF transporter T component CbiQ [bacterium]